MLVRGAWAELDLDEAPSTLAGRVGADEASAPVVVIAAPGAASDEVLGRISAKAKAGSAELVLVAPGPVVGATWRSVSGADRGRRARTRLRRSSGLATR